MSRLACLPGRITRLGAVVFVLCATSGLVRAQGAEPSAAPAAEPPASAAPAAEAEPAAAASTAGWRRDGVNPCNTPDPGWGVYDRWSRASSMGQMIAPQKGGMTRSGGFDLVVHFHGHEPIRKEFVKTAKGIVLVGVDLGIGSGPYSQAFASPTAFERLLASVEQEMARRSGRKKAHVRKLALSAWSAGYGAIEQILRQPAGKKVDALILLDSVHTGYLDAEQLRLDTTQLEPFVEFARQAARGSRLMFQSYSSIQPPGFASTRECAHYVIQQLGGKPRSSQRSDVLGLELFERYDRGGYHARGYRGDDKPDHCAHIGLMKEVVRLRLEPRWQTPPGRLAPGKPGEKKKAPPGGSVHVVTDGQSLGAIAKRYQVTVEAIREANGLAAKGRPIQPGDELVIPPPERGTEPDRPAGAKRAPRPGESVHTVVDGQSLGGIAKRYRVSVDALREANPAATKGRKIQPGDVLVIPAPPRQAEAAPRPAPRGPRAGETIHVVERGESLWGIAKKYETTVAALLEANGLREDGPPLQEGQKLVIPKGKKGK